MIYSKKSIKSRESHDSKSVYELWLVSRYSVVYYWIDQTSIISQKQRVKTRPATYPHDKVEGSCHSGTNEELVDQIIRILSNPDLSNWYQTVTTTIQVQGCYVNHKKVYRLESENGLLGKARKKTGRRFVKFRRVAHQVPCLY
ncbi:MAG: hypothetical protein AAGA77_23595 [Bacteroidota bacterium]